MKMEFCNVSLRRLTIDDIEMVRLWRNDEKISKHMFFQDEITPAMQMVWFNGLQEATDFYFIIEHNNSPIGLAHLNHVEAEKGTGNVGLFIHNEAYWGTPTPIMASITLLDFAFENLKLMEVTAKVRIENKKAIDYNKKLGFKTASKTSYSLSSIDYETKTLRLKKQVENWYSKLH